jgi:hypothetical protein
MKGWKKGCFDAVDENDASAIVQSNDYVRGNLCRPMCVTSDDSTYGRVLKYYSLPKGKNHVIEEALYIKEVENLDGVSNDVEMGLKYRLYEPLQWIHAGIVFAILEKPELAKACDEKAGETV